MRNARRYVVVSVPTDDGALWFVFDRHALRSVHECESRDDAAECVLCSKRWRY